MDDLKTTEIPEVPSIELPKGGGAISNIGEKYEVNNQTGTASFSLPLPLSSGRDGFGPPIALAYDSGAGNGPFGLGWKLGGPHIVRKTSNGLPLYQDAIEKDTFLLSGMEDLLPIQEWDETEGKWVRTQETTIDHVIYSYRPRVEGGYAKIQRWHDPDTGISFWKVFGSNGIISTYGESSSAREADPEDDTRVFKWLLEEMVDQKGNIIAFTYKSEDQEGITTDSSAEIRRLAHVGDFPKKYLKSVQYGNQAPNVAADFHFQMILDYGEHTDDTTSEVSQWDTRLDPFSSYRSGFEIRTYRLCKRILMFHEFTELGVSPVLVRSLNLSYEEGERFSLLQEGILTGYQPHASGVRTKSYPPIAFTYSTSDLPDPAQIVERDNKEEIPVPGHEGRSIWVDLEGEGIPGILIHGENNWQYSANRGEASFTVPRQLTSIPQPQADRGQIPILTDINNDGIKELVLEGKNLNGYYALEGGEPSFFVPFEGAVAHRPQGKSVSRMDLTGNGLPDIVVRGNDVIWWYQMEGLEGWLPAKAVLNEPLSEEGTTLVQRHGLSSLYQADMSGDGMADLVQIDTNRVVYWPNLGYGKFGEGITMHSPPDLSVFSEYTPSRIKLVDLDGTGTADLLYIGAEGVYYWYNGAGNQWTEQSFLSLEPNADPHTQVEVMDLLGKGTSCLVWQSPSAVHGGRKLCYLDLFPEGKPFLMSGVNNNLGRSVSYTYAPSTEFYLNDLANGNPWLTKLHFPVHVVKKMQVYDEISQSSSIAEYHYRHGYYDHQEKEFRGFGFVEQSDSDVFEEWEGADSLDMPPIVTRQWFYTGAWPDKKGLSDGFREEFYQGDSDANEMQHYLFEDNEDWDTEAYREAHRALKGRTIREEIYADDGSPEAEIPYSVAEYTYLVTQLQPAVDHHPGSYNQYMVENMAYAYDRSGDDPRTSQKIFIEHDEWGNPIKSVLVTHPRRVSAGTGFEAQDETRITCDVIKLVNETSAGYVLGLPYEAMRFQVGNLTPADGSYFTRSELITELDGLFDAGAYLKPHEDFGIGVEARLLNWRQTYFDDSTGTLLGLGSINLPLLPAQTKVMLFHDDFVSDAFDSKVNTTMLEDAGYEKDISGYWWNDGPLVGFGGSAGFFRPITSTDPNGVSIDTDWDTYSLFAKTRTDALGNEFTTDIDYLTLSPASLTDINDNITTTIKDALGQVIATFVEGTYDGGTAIGDDDPTNYTITAPANKQDVIDNPLTYLQGAGSYFYYDLESWNADPPQPPGFVALRAETHYSELSGGATTEVQIQVGYSDGFGRELQSKIKVDDGPVSEGDPVTERWAVSGRTVYNNRDKPVKQYEPFYTEDPDYQEEETVSGYGVTRVQHYDAIGRELKLVHPDGLYSKNEFSPWTIKAYDENDTLSDSDFYNDNLSELGSGSDIDKRLSAGLDHDDTPLIKHLDIVGNVFREESYPDPTGSALITATEFNVFGDKISQTDPRQYDANLTRSPSDQVKNFIYTYDQAGNLIKTVTIDAGTGISLTNSLGNVVKAWNDRGYTITSEYDDLGRISTVHLDGGGLNQIMESYEYGETASNPKDNNLRGALYILYDQAGKVVNEGYDLSRNLISSARTFCSDFKAEPDWTTPASVSLESDTYTSSVTYNAMGLATSMTRADDSITYPIHRPDGRLISLEVQLKDDTSNTTIVSSVDYNPRGQRLSITYGNDLKTSYTYDTDSFRLTALKTTRTELSGSFTHLQDIGYLFDPAGNVIQVEDKSQEQIFTNNQSVDAISTYTYDSLYRLTETTGREHLGLGKTDYQDTPEHFRSKLLAGINDLNQLRNYTRKFTYDDSNNLTQIQHIGDSSFTRDIDVSTTSNRAISDEMASPPSIESYFDAAGNITELEHLAGITWNYRNNIGSATMVSRSSEDDIEYYVYDGGGSRARKVTETYDSLGNLLTRISKYYLNGIEIRKKYTGISETLKEVRYSLHIKDDDQRICIDHYYTLTDDTSVTTSTHYLRYQHGNHLGSSSLETNASGDLLSYEEYFPYGGTSFTTGDSAVEVSRKEFRFSGKERDDTTGLYYFGARYYCPWLGRWLNPDSAGDVDGLNLYAYGKGNPLTFVDPNGNLCLICWLLFEPTYDETGDFSGIKMRDDETSRRTMGAIQTVGGGLEVTGGVFLMFTPGGQFIGALMILHGADTAQAGIRQGISGERVRTLTSQGITLGLETSTLLEGENAVLAGDLGDAGVGILLSGGGLLVTKLGPGAVTASTKLIGTGDDAGTILTLVAQQDGTFALADDVDDAARLLPALMDDVPVQVFPSPSGATGAAPRAFYGGDGFPLLTETQFLDELPMLEQRAVMIAQEVHAVNPGMIPSQSVVAAGVGADADGWIIIVAKNTGNLTNGQVAVAEDLGGFALQGYRVPGIRYYDDVAGLTTRTGNPKLYIHAETNLMGAADMNGWGLYSVYSYPLAPCTLCNPMLGANGVTIITP